MSKNRICDQKIKIWTKNQNYAQKSILFKSSCSNLNENQLGRCSSFTEDQIGGERFNFFEGCPNAKTCSILLRGGAEQFLEETERSLHDAIMIDAVFYRPYPFLYHKFGNMVIFRPENLYSLCSPENQDSQKLINFHFFIKTGQL